MSSIKPQTSSRYASVSAGANSSLESRSSTRSDPSSSSELAPKSRSIVPTKPPHRNANFGSMVKKLVDPRSGSKKKPTEYKLAMPADFIAEDLKRTAKRGAGLGALHKKLFKGSVKKGDVDAQTKALTEVRGNTRTLGMVLRSERELLGMNQEQENQIAELKLLLEEKNKEVEKLKDLCLKQREEIKSLKSAVLFPDITNSQMQDLVEKQASELKQARQLIPSLQRQVSSLTDQLQYLAEDLAEVKADKYSIKTFYDSCASSPRTPEYDQGEVANSLAFSSEDDATPASPDDMLIKDLNPCLTPYSKTKSNEFDTFDVPNQNLHTRKLSKSSDCCQCSKPGNNSARIASRSNESKRTHRKQLQNKFSSKF